MKPVQGAAAILALVMTAGIALYFGLRKELSPRDRFQAAITTLGIEPGKVADLRDQFERTVLERDRDPCNDTARLLAGQAAVAYYETLLEQPFSKAKLSMTSRNVCSAGADGIVVYSDPLSLVAGFRRGLRLPWDCLPDEWRTPRDLALQAKLEADIRQSRLTADELTGTLGTMSETWANSPRARSCETKSASNRTAPARRKLPLLAPPPDDWSDRRRR